MTRPVAAIRWLVVGHQGMLGTDVMAELRGRDVTGVDRPDIDITDVTSVADHLVGYDLVVNCAAYTAVDDAETHEADAFAVNAVGPANLARTCSRTGARMLHISTDYVFSGDATAPYPEGETPAPSSAYGRSKAAGEWAVRAELPDRSWLLRTAWLYGAHGPNFVRTIAGLERTRETLDVVDDQRGQPTWSRDLARRVVETVEADVPAGIYHATSSGETTWFEFARRIFALLGTDPNRVRPTTSATFTRPAPRPAYSVLGHSAWEGTGLAPIRDWSAALDASWAEVEWQAPVG